MTPAELARWEDPIAAVATAAGPGAVGIVRLSGPDLRGFIQAWLGRDLVPRMATLLPLPARDGSAIDTGLAIHFPGPNSYTGEDVLELQAHGGPVVLQLLLARCFEVAAAVPACERLRLAQAGEFTRRAFLNGKLDLAQAEAVADLIAASTEAAARSASRSLAGAFSVEIGSLTGQVVHARTLVEATLDFPEEDIDFIEQYGIRTLVEALAAQLAAVQAQTCQGAILREGVSVVLAGQPNVGKSSLLNALAGAELAIVTAVPGTTRDRVSQTLQIDGVPLHIIDTAGLRDTQDEVERIGIERSWQAIAQADVLLWLRDLSLAADPAYATADAALAGELAQALSAPGGAGRIPVLQVWNKLDAFQTPVSPSEPSDTPLAVTQTLRLSARSGDGLDALRQALLAAVGWQGGGSEGLFSARARHVEALGRAQTHIAAALDHLSHPAPLLDLIAEELRLAHDELGQITGQFSSEDLLGAIFGRFCIGK
ncbi:tRNA uridine-5-carboxymethylaminomethyl(34) synthesis GTPase MnmE [Amphibiibacter pelophylacis]|uniref:tRNA uridine-5-carboxymethylaminomethyl(34) synthesis GTPase MnmE n=1 Tax=Amphibiibacter pelophylacis TaxID=1799477 RepID=A0ACC6P5D2_9BURK